MIASVSIGLCVGYIVLLFDDRDTIKLSYSISDLKYVIDKCADYPNTDYIVNARYNDIGSSFKILLSALLQNAWRGQPLGFAAQNLSDGGRRN